MKKVFYILLTGLWLLASNSCALEDIFLEKPDTSGLVDTDAIYSSTKNAEAALFRCYRDVLRHGWPGGLGFSHGTLGALSGEVSRGPGAWAATWNLNIGGLMSIPQRGNSGFDHTNPTATTPTSAVGTDHYWQNWEYIRACFLVKENIDGVPDMSDIRKQYIKAEATALIAYRYMGMFIRYGGIQIVRKAYLPDDDVEIPRAALQETLDYILELFDEAIPALPESWANFEGSNFVGRITRGAALAMKARLLMFAARPLFNSATPYYPFGENNNLISFGSANPQRWQDAIAANEAVLTWAATNGYRLIHTAGEGNRNTFDQAKHDYGTATSTPGNPEVILAYKQNSALSIAGWYNISGAVPDPYGSVARSDKVYYGMLTNFLENYRSREGEEIDWPNATRQEAGYRPFSNFLENIDKIEARYLMDVAVQTRGSANNPGVSGWNSAWGWGMTNREISSTGVSTWFPASSSSRFGYGCGPSTKFYYRAGSRGWFEPPLFRLAETYLNLAEAYNEAGNTELALRNLNMVHHRAGLPAITEANQQALRQLIWREKAVEFFHENHRYFDAKHWKHPEIATNIHGGEKREFYFLQRSDAQLEDQMWGYWDAKVYSSFWSDKMFLEPFPQYEVNKGFIVQNPGY